METVHRCRGVATAIFTLPQGSPRALEAGEVVSAGISLVVTAGVAGTGSVEAWKQAPPAQGRQNPPRLGWTKPVPGLAVAGSLIRWFLAWGR